MFRGFRHPVAFLLALAILGQGVGLIGLDRLGLKASIQCLLVSLAVAGTIHEIWRNRLRLDHRVDMLVIMLAFGGLGMLVGTGVDLALAKAERNTGLSAFTETKPACCGRMPTAMNHVIDGGKGNTSEVRGNGSFWHGISRSLASWMTGLMLLGGIPPSWFLTRCAALAHASRRRWIATHLAGNLGMVAGMIAAGMLFGHALGLGLGSMVTGHHLAMLAGMLAGMTAGQFLAEAALGLHPWRKVIIVN